MELKHAIYHATKDRMTNAFTIVCLVFWIVFYFMGGCDLKWLFAMLMLNIYAYTFRRALKRLL